MAKKIAIIGASSGQLPICLKAKEMGLEVYVFAWEKNAICKPYADHFVPISIMEKDQIADYCSNIGIDGVVSNGSDATAEVVSYIATKLQLIGVNYECFKAIRDKYHVRQLAQSIPGLTPIHTHRVDDTTNTQYPCIVKPVSGSSKCGVSFVHDETEWNAAIQYAKSDKTDIIVEEYIEGSEFSVETISFQGHHMIVQTTDKDNSGAPHFVELGHHQPAQLPLPILDKLHNVIPALLTKTGYTNGPAHIEFRYHNDDLYLIELNPRGGGDEISNKLVQLSSGHDYLRYMIEVALGDFKGIDAVPLTAYAGIYFLCQQTKQYLPAFLSAANQEWLVEKKIDNTQQLTASTSNYDRNGYLIYQSDRKISLI